MNVSSKRVRSEMLRNQHEETADEYSKGMHRESPYAQPADSRQRRSFGLLERSTVKVVRSVLRGVGSGDGARLPGLRHEVAL